MESLYTKYRPQVFADVAGQGAVVGALERAVRNQSVGHAYLFCGPRGTGKTTLARILAKALECECGLGELPDGTCEQCKAVAAGVHPDVLEVDAASRTSVNDVREEIISTVDFAPVMGRAKVYVIDEVHMLSNQAFNALLKTLEEPPDHVTFVLCTTDPQKVPATILSRVQRFNFSPLSDDDIRKRLEVIASQEGIEVSDEAMALIVRHALGGMRDAISVLEQLAIFGNGVVGEDITRDLLGESDQDLLSSFVEALAQKNATSLFELTAEVVGAGRDLSQFVMELLERVRDLYVVSVAGLASGLLFDKEEAEATLKREAALFATPERLSRILEELDRVAYAMRSSPDQRIVFEVALTKLVRPQCDLSLEALAERVEALESKSFRKNDELPERVFQSERSRARSEPVRESRFAAETSYSKSVPPWEKSEPLESLAQKQGEPAMEDASSESSRSQDRLNRSPEKSASAVERSNPWEGVLHALPSHISGCLVGSRVRSDDGETLIIELTEASNFTRQILTRDDVRHALEIAASAVYGPRKVRYVAARTNASSHGGAEASSSDLTVAPSQAPVPEPSEPEAPVPDPSGLETPVPEPSEPEAPVPDPSGLETPASEPSGLEAPKSPELPESPKPEASQSHAKEQRVSDSPAAHSIDERYADILQSLTEAFGEVQVLPLETEAPTITDNLPDDA